MKAIFNTVGVLAVLLALIGVFLPLLPTTPFLLLASACFAKGSERMHQWLLGNRLFGSTLKNIQEKRGIPARAKAIAITLLWASMGLAVLRINPLLLKLLLGSIGIAVTAYLLCMKTLREPV